MNRPQPFAFRVGKDSLQAFKKAAEGAGLSVSEWARLMLDAAAGVSDLPAQLTRVVEYRPKPVRDGKW